MDVLKLCLMEILEKRKKVKKICNCFLDILKAFDISDLAVTWAILEAYEMEQNWWDYWKALAAAAAQSLLWPNNDLVTFEKTEVVVFGLNKLEQDWQ